MGPPLPLNNDSRLRPEPQIGDIENDHEPVDVSIYPDPEKEENDE